MTTITSRRPDLAGVAAVTVATLIVVGLAVPHDVLAAAGSGGGAPDAARAFNKNGLASLKFAGAVIFGVAAVWGLARAAFGGKVGQGLLQASVAAVGFAVAAGPDAVLHTVGGWGTDLFTS